MCGFDSDFFPECKSGMYYFGSDQSSVPMNKAWNDIFTHLGHAKDSDQTELIAKLFFCCFTSRVNKLWSLRDGQFT